MRPRQLSVSDIQAGFALLGIADDEVRESLRSLAPAPEPPPGLRLATATHTNLDLTTGVGDAGLEPDPQ